MDGQDASRDAAPAAGAALPSVPDAAATVFGDRLPLARGFVQELATTGVERGLLGPREVPRLWERHVLNCAVVAEVIPPSVAVVDVGSGAGLPGVALAIARPDLVVHLVEPMRRRTEWLTHMVDVLDLDHVTVHHARAQDVVGVLEVPVATARAVTRIGQLARWCAPLVQPGGQVLAIKGSSVEEELASDEPLVRRAGVRDVEVVRCGAGVIDPPTTVARLMLREDHRPGLVPADDLRRGRAGKGRRRRPE